MNQDANPDDHEGEEQVIHLDVIDLSEPDDE